MLPDFKISLNCIGQKLINNLLFIHVALFLVDVSLVELIPLACSVLHCLIPEKWEDIVTHTRGSIKKKGIFMTRTWDK